MPATAAPANWFAEVARFLTGGGWPDDYLVLDVETNGLDVRSDAVLPVQLGWAAVEGRVVTHAGEVVLDWTGRAYGHGAWLGESLEKTRRGMEARGAVYPFTEGLMRAEGVDPLAGLAALQGLIKQAVARRYMVAGFNHVGFDLPILARCWRTYGPAEFAVPSDLLLDAGLVEKCRMLQRPPPMPGATPVAAWYEAVRADRRRVKWNLSEHCRDVYSLPVDHSRAHGAGYDAHTTHLLIEAMRALSRD